MSLFIIILGTVIVLGGLHMIAPDHWVPLMIVSRKMNYSQRRTNISAAALGSLHAITSEALAGIALVVGAFLVKSFLHYLELASIILLVIVGVYFVVNGYTEENPEAGYNSSSLKSILAISAFPDFALVPVMLAAASLSIPSISIVLISFVLVSALSLSLMVFTAEKGVSKALERIPPRFIDYIMGLVLFITAAVIALFAF